MPPMEGCTESTQSPPVSYKSSDYYRGKHISVDGGRDSGANPGCINHTTQ